LDQGACRCSERKAEGVEDRFVTNNLGTLLTALYVDLDDRVLPALGWSRDHRPGRKPALSDAELACLAAAQHLLGIGSERRWIRYAHAHRHSRFFWGFRLYVITTAEGMPIIWGLAHPGLGEREVVAALVTRDHHLVRGGQIILGDKGFAGRDFEAFITGQLGAHLIRPDRKDEPARFGNLARYRQWIEAITGTLKGQLTLEHHGGRTLAGVCARVAAPCSPWPPPSGTTGTSEHPSSAP
jgi:hypothetical protein